MEPELEVYSNSFLNIVLYLILFFIACGRPHVFGIPNTRMVVSLQSTWSESANLEVFDISKKKKQEEFTRLERFVEVNSIKSLFTTPSYLGPGNGDLSYNSRRGLLAALPDTGKIAYRLFSIDAHTTSPHEIFKLSRRSKWRSQYSDKYGD